MTALVITGSGHLLPDGYWRRAALALVLDDVMGEAWQKI